MEIDGEIVPEINIFANRANSIVKSKLEAHEKMNAEVIEEETSKNEETEYNDLLGKIKEKMKRKPARGKKGKAAKKAKADSESAEEETSIARRTRRSTRSTKHLEEDCVEVPLKNKVSSPVKLPVLAKRRLQELKLKTNREAAQVEEEFRRTLLSCDKDFLEASETILDIDATETITLKIRYMSQITKVDVGEHEKFSTIFTKVADLYKLKASEILLCLEEQNIQLEDTPHSLKLKFYDLIDCIPFKASQIPVKDDDPNRLLIKFQSSDSRKKIEMHIHKLDKFQDFLEKYSKLRDIPMKDLTFEFDGETIEGSETPEDLDMESGSCIDVRVAKAKEEEKYAALYAEVADPIPQSEMLDICVLD